MNVVDFGEPRHCRGSSDPLGYSVCAAETVERPAFGNGRSGESGDRRVGDMQPQTPLLRRRQRRCAGVRDKGCELADDAHGVIAQGDGISIFIALS